MAEADIQAAPRPAMSQLAGPILVVLILAMMVLPLPPFVLDLLFTFNISVSLLVVLMAVYVNRPLDFSLFPTVLLMTTLLRLSLNVASTRVVLLSAFVDSALAYRALGVGAAGYLSKDSTGERICDAIAAVSRGETVLDPEVQAGVAHEIRLRVEDERPALTSREREILRLTADGCSAPQIAERLYLSPNTVRTHLQHLYDKLGVSDRAAAVAEAMRQRLLE